MHFDMHFGLYTNSLPKLQTKTSFFPNHTKQTMAGLTLSKSLLFTFRSTLLTQTRFLSSTIPKNQPFRHQTSLKVSQGCCLFFQIRTLMLRTRTMELSCL